MRFQEVIDENKEGNDTTNQRGEEKKEKRSSAGSCMIVDSFNLMVVRHGPPVRDLIAPSP